MPPIFQNDDSSTDCKMNVLADLTANDKDAENNGRTWCGVIDYRHVESCICSVIARPEQRTQA